MTNIITKVSKNMGFRNLFLALCLFAGLFPAVAKAQFCPSIWGSPYSWITVSESGEYEFVLLCNRDIDKYFKEQKAGWKSLGHSKKLMTSLEKMILEDISREKEIRQKFKKGGLYKKGNFTQPIFTLESFPQEIDRIYVANDGSYVVGINNSIPFSEKPIPEKLINSEEIALITLATDKPDLKTCSIKLVEVGLKTHSVRNSSDYLFWAYNHISLNNRDDTLKIPKAEGKEMIFDVMKCRFID